MFQEILQGGSGGDALFRYKTEKGNLTTTGITFNLDFEPKTMIFWQNQNGGGVFVRVDFVTNNFYKTVGSGLNVIDNSWMTSGYVSKNGKSVTVKAWNSVWSQASEFIFFEEQLVFE